VIAALATLSCGAPREATPPSSSTGNAPARGGELTVTVRTEPQSFSWYTHHDATLDIVTILTHGKLVRINRATQELEPGLAESWSRSPDGLTYTVKLLPNVRFSDGHPFTADDVVFSVAAAYDPKAGIQMRGDMLVAGRPVIAAATTPDTVVLTFPAPFAPGLRIFDQLPILPKHELEPALKAGTFASAWTLSTPVTEIVGLGPFVLSDFQPGQRMVFARNEHYFKQDASGVQLPYLDRIVMDIVPDQNTQRLRLEAGQADMQTDEVRPEDYAAIKRAADAGRLQLFDLGEGLVPDSFWINLRPGAFGRDPRAVWLQSEPLRHAISLAVDRRAFADTVYLGAGAAVYGPITPANKKWHADAVPQTPHDPARAKAMLAQAGLIDRNGDGIVEDERGNQGRFSISTQKGRSSLERGAVVIRDDLRKIGLVVDIVPMEGNALVQRLQSSQGYEAAFFQLPISDTEPAALQEYFLSSGGFHVWHYGQKKPATEWERRIDELMARYATSLDPAEQKKAFDEVQLVFAEHLPVIHFAAPRVFVAASARTLNLQPAVLRPQLLWAADSIGVRK
jgi:peptide/nickel transport system substrate-binding protein